MKIFICSLFVLFALSTVSGNPITVEEVEKSVEVIENGEKKGFKVFDILFSRVKDNVRTLKDNVNYVKYSIDKQPLVEQFKNFTHFNMIEENASYLKNQSLEKYFAFIDQIFDGDILDELNKTDKFDRLEDKLLLLNEMRNCLVNMLQSTLYKNMNEVFRVIATYINLIDSTVVKLDQEQEIDLSYFRHLIKDILKFVQKFVFVFDGKDFKCDKINIF